MQDSDRRFRNEPDRIETDNGREDAVPDRQADPAWMPETNSGRAAMATTVRAYRSAEGGKGVARGARAPVAQAMKGTGRPLEQRAVQAGTAAGFGDLSGVQIHTDPGAADAASSIGAKAFTVGNDVFFGAGHYAPGTPEGDQLLGHELAHTAQQRGASPEVQTKLEVSSPGESLEVEADQAGSTFARAARGEEVAAAPIHSTAQTIARDVATGTTTAQAVAPEGRLTERQVRAAIAFNRGRHFPAEVLAQIARVVGAGSGDLGAPLVQAIANFQATHGFEVDGAVGDITMQRMSQSPGGQGLDRQVKSDATVFVGMNPDSKGVELATLKGAAGGSNVTGLTGERKQDTALVGGRVVDLNTSEGLDAFLGQLGRLDPARRQQARAFIEGGSSMSKDELAQLVKVMYQAESGQRLVKRMVLSGHSGGTSVWGDGNGTLSFSHLATLKDIFPNALGQVEDLMLSACNTGFKEDAPRYLAIFPNLRTIWAYAGYSPSAATGSTRHIAQWERSSRGAASHEKMNDGREAIGRGSGKRDDNVAVWTNEQGASEKYQSHSEYLAGDFASLKQQIDDNLAYDQAYLYGQIDQGALDRLYIQVQSLVGNHAAQLGDELSKYELMKQRLLYLRHWNNITRNFMQNHGASVRSSYSAARQAVPSFSGMARHEVQAKFAQFTGDQTSEGYLLLKAILIDLDPARIPDNWN